MSQLEARKQVLRKAGRCYSCVRRGHLGRNCRSSSKNRLCQDRHHTSICSTTPEVSSQTTTVVAPSAEKTHLALNPSVPEFPPNTVHTLYVGTPKPVLLQTATAWTYNPYDHGKNEKLRIVMDGGSQPSYIAEAARKALHLPTADKRRLTIAAFGSKRTKPRPCDMVRVEVHKKAGEPTPVDLFVVPYICEPIA